MAQRSRAYGQNSPPMNTAPGPPDRQWRLTRFARSGGLDRRGRGGRRNGTAAYCGDSARTVLEGRERGWTRDAGERPVRAVPTWAGPFEVTANECITITITTPTVPEGISTRETTRGGAFPLLENTAAVLGGERRPLPKRSDNLASSQWALGCLPGQKHCRRSGSMVQRRGFQIFLLQVASMRTRARASPRCRWSSPSLTESETRRRRLSDISARYRKTTAFALAFESTKAATRPGERATARACHCRRHGRQVRCGKMPRAWRAATPEPKPRAREHAYSCPWQVGGARASMARLGRGRAHRSPAWAHPRRGAGLRKKSS